MVVVNGSWDGFGSGEDEQAAGSERASESRRARRERRVGVGVGERAWAREREGEAGLAGLAAGTSGGRALDWEREMGGGELDGWRGAAWLVLAGPGEGAGAVMQRCQVAGCCWVGAVVGGEWCWP